jgi:hypothetical protein
VKQNEVFFNGHFETLQDVSVAFSAVCVPF